jgi:hypothetical protein
MTPTTGRRTVAWRPAVSLRPVCPAPAQARTGNLQGLPGITRSRARNPDGSFAITDPASHGGTNVNGKRADHAKLPTEQDVTSAGHATFRPSVGTFLWLSNCWRRASRYARRVSTSPG